MKRTREKISNLTTYRFGGVCENVVTIETIDDILQIEDEIHYDNFYILGKGSNVAFSDKDFDKLLLIPQIKDISINNKTSEVVALKTMMRSTLKTKMSTPLTRRTEDWKTRDCTTTDTPTSSARMRS